MTSRHSQDAALGLPFALALFGHLALLAVLIFSYQWSRLEIEPAGEILDAPTIDVSEVRKALKRAPSKPEPQPEPQPEPTPEPPKPDPQEELQKQALEREQLRAKEEQTKAEAAKKAEEEAKRIALEKKKKKEAEEKKKELEKKKKDEEKKKEELRKKEEAEKKKKADDEKRKKDEADKKKKDEAEKKKKAEEEQKRKEEEKRRQQAEDELASELEAEAKNAASARRNAAQNELSKYVGLIENKVKRNWIKPENPNGEAILRLRLAPDGSVLDVMSCEGDRLMCESATRAVYKAEPLPVPQDKSLFEEYFKVFRLRMTP